MIHCAPVKVGVACGSSSSRLKTSVSGRARAAAGEEYLFALNTLQPVSHNTRGTAPRRSSRLASKVLHSTLILSRAHWARAVASNSPPSRASPHGSSSRQKTTFARKGRESSRRGALVRGLHATSTVPSTPNGRAPAGPPGMYARFLYSISRQRPPSHTGGGGEADGLRTAIAARSPVHGPSTWVRG